jgi:pyrimidine deaminase RibD-like protein
MECSMENDLRFMQIALERPERLKAELFPYPAVGAVVVNEGRIVGKGALPNLMVVLMQKRSL